MGWRLASLHSGIGITTSTVSILQMASILEICRACDPAMIIKKPHSAGCLVRSSDRELLMVQKKDDMKWTFPAGNIENQLETPQEAATRETL
jgi:NUDIX domain